MTLPVVRASLVCLLLSHSVFADARLPAPPIAQRWTPAQLDALYTQEAGQLATSTVSDEVFLRRLTLDLIGRAPTAEEVTAFRNDVSEDRRHRLVERLLASSEFGTNWGNYWVDTIRFHIAPPELTFLRYDGLRGWFARRFNENQRWDAIVRELLTATGTVRANPATVFIAYHQADAEKLAAETSRIFLGLQIQCAQCHDHKFDHWQRKQFHSLAAFFARTGAKLTQNDPGPTEVKDKGKGEHEMPNAADPRKKGTVMAPVFLNGAAPAASANDLERRTFLAQHLTAADNPWFAAAFVNRIGARLFGRGFYDPVDNQADYQDHHLPKLHAALAGHFTESGFDVKDLFRLIVRSAAYQRSLAESPDPKRPFASGIAVRLRGDEVFESLQRALDLPILTPPATKPTAAVRFPPPPKSTRDMIVDQFAFDPSLCPEEITWNMGQAMMLMNNLEIQAQIDASPKSNTALSRLLAREKDDRIAIVKLYQSVLARLPTDREIELVSEHIANVGHRPSAFEDVLWALINSAEFHVRR